MRKILLFPIDLARVTWFFLWITFCIVQRWVARLSLGQWYPGIKPCNPITQEDEDADRVCNQSLGFGSPLLLRMLCTKILSASGGTCDGYTGRCMRRGSFRISLPRYVVVGLLLTLLWGGIAKSGSIAIGHLRERFGEPQHGEESASEQYARQAEALLTDGEFARARVQYMNAVREHPERTDYLWGLAQCAIELNHIQEAESAYRKILELDAEHLDAHLALADLLLRAGDASAARPHAATSLLLAPSNALAHSLVGESDRLLGNSDAANEAAQNALRLDNELPMAIQLAAGAALDEDNLLLAEELYQRLRKADPSSVEAYAGLASVRARDGDAQGAIEMLEVVRERNPNHVAAMITLGETLMRNGLLDEADGLYTKLSAQHPESIRARSSLAGLRLADGRLDEAHAMGEALLLDAPDSPAGNLVLGTVYFLKRLSGAAEKQCLACLEKAPDLVAAHKLIARVRMQTGNWAGAIPFLQKLIEVNPDVLDYRIFLGSCHIARGDYGHARLVLQAATEAFPDSEWPHIELGRLYLNQGDVGAAAQSYEQALEINPQHHVPLNNLASIYMDTHPGLPQDLARARTLAEQALKRYSNSYEIADTLGQVYVRLGEATRAAPILAYAAQLAPGNPEIRYHLAKALHAMSRTQDARAQLQLALNLSTNFTGAYQARRLLESLGPDEEPKDGRE